MRGETADAFEWTAVMYIDDILGGQEHDKPAETPGVLKWATSRKAKRAKWPVIYKRSAEVIGISPGALKVDTLLRPTWKDHSDDVDLAT